ncbi:MAG: AsmA-like C-terminal domain-containing protein [Alphaproteobacteria bacterium]
MHRTVTRFLIQSFAAAVFGVGLLAGLLVWQLAQGPIRLQFLTPYIEAALNPPGQAFAVRLSHTLLTWAGWERTLDVRAVDVRVTGADGRLVASIPQLSLGLSARALFRGMLAPKSLDVIGARLRLVHTEDGQLSLGLGRRNGEPRPEGDTTEFARSLLAELLRSPDPTKATGYLSRLSVIDAELIVEDRGRNVFWTAPSANISLVRDEAGIRARARLEVAIDGLRGKFEALATYAATTGDLGLTLVFENAAPPLLASIEPALAELRRLDLPLSGTVALALDAGFRPTAVTFDLAGGAGTVALPEYYARPVPVDGLELRGRLLDGGERLILDQARMDFGGPTVDLRAAASRVGERIAFDLQGEANGIPANDLGTLWPKGLADGARKWVTANLHDGTFERATLRLSGSAPVDDWSALSIDDLGGTLEAGGMRVHYLRPMSPVVGARARAEFDRRHILISVDAGTLDELRVERATIDLVNLDRPPGWADINVTVTGPVADALRLIDEPPLHYADTLGFDPVGIAGQQRTNLVMRVPLREKQGHAGVEVAAASSIIDFASERGVFGQPVRDGRLTLKVDKTRLTVSGNLAVAGAPMQVSWQHNFTDGAEFLSRYEIKGLVDEAARQRSAFAAVPFLQGPFGIELTYTEYPGGIAQGLARLDLTNATVDLGRASWRKGPGVPGRGYAEFIIENGRLSRVPIFDLAAGSLLAQGTAEFTPTGLRRIAFRRLAFGETDINGTAELGEDGAYNVLLAGRRLDLRPIFDGDDGDDESGETSPAPPFSVTITPVAPLALVRLGDDTTLANVVGSVRHDGEDWRSASIEGELSEGGRLTIRLTERDSGRDLSVVAEDAGALLRATKLHREVEGGRLEIEGVYDDLVPGKPLVGRALMTDFRVHKAPVLATILTLSSLPGIMDTLGGNGIAFSRLELPFRLTDARLEIIDAKARGSDLGISGAGVIDLTTDQIDFSGDVVPAYTINGLLAKIPLLGQLIAGGQDGIFAAAYKVTGPVDDPKVSVNPLTVFTPGIIRSVFGVFGRPSPLDGQTTPSGEPVDGP